MMKATVFRVALALGVITTAAAIAQPAGRAAAAPEAALPLTSAELAAARIQLQPPSSLAITKSVLSDSEAIAVGNATVPGLVVMGTLRAYASQYEDASDPVRAVVVVLYSGGHIPRDPAPGEGDGPFLARVTGIVVDAGTGEFMRGFMIP